MSFIDLTNKRFGRLIALERKGNDWICECDCGNQKDIKAYRLRSGRTKSCGCLRPWLSSFKILGRGI